MGVPLELRKCGGDGIGGPDLADAPVRTDPGGDPGGPGPRRTIGARGSLARGNESNGRSGRCGELRADRAKRRGARAAPERALSPAGLPRRSPVLGGLPAGRRRGRDRGCQGGRPRTGGRPAPARYAVAGGAVETGGGERPSGDGLRARRERAGARPLPGGGHRAGDGARRPPRLRAREHRNDAKGANPRRSALPQRRLRRASAADARPGRRHGRGGGSGRRRGPAAPPGRVGADRARARASHPAARHGRRPHGAHGERRADRGRRDVRAARGSALRREHGRALRGPGNAAGAGPAAAASSRRGPAPAHARDPPRTHRGALRSRPPEPQAARRGPARNAPAPDVRNGRAIG